MKTIMVHMADDSESAHRLAVAVALAATHAASLVGVFARPSPAIPAAIRGRGFSTVFLREIRSSMDEHERNARSAFEGAAAKAGLPAEWRRVEGELMEGLSLNSQYADLAIVSQTPPDTMEEWLTGECPDHLTLTAGCPTIVVPHARAPMPVGRRVLVAWRATREAARAVRDALPLLREAEQVTVLTVGPSGADHIPGADIAAFIARHGVTVETRTNYGSGEPGEIVLSHAGDIGADLIVMGAYGRSRLRELILGGTTKHVLSRTTVPVCLSH